MKVELRKVKYSAALSEETAAFTADVYVDGKKVGTASNHGTGGSNDIHWTDRAAGGAFAAYLKTLPPETFAITEDYFFSTLIEEYLTAKDAEKEKKRLAKQAEKAKAKGLVLLVVKQKVNAITRTVSIAVSAGAEVEQWTAKLLAKYPGGEATVLA